MSRTCLLVASLSLGQALAAAEPVPGPSHERGDGRADAAPVENYCIGGIEDGKLIPFNGVVENAFRQTTSLGCAVDGGQPTFMPDLDPAIKDGVLT